MPVRFATNVLVPGWIMTFGLVALCGQPLGVSLSVSLCAVGVLVIPALILMPRLRVSAPRVVPHGTASWWKGAGPVLRSIAVGGVVWIMLGGRAGDSRRRTVPEMPALSLRAAAAL